VCRKEKPHRPPLLVDLGLLARNERAQFLCILESELHDPPLRTAGGGRELAATNSGSSRTTRLGLGGEPRGRRQDRPAGTRSEVRRRGAEGAAVWGSGGGGLVECAVRAHCPCRPCRDPRPGLPVRETVTAQYSSSPVDYTWVYFPLMKKKLKKHSYVN